MPLIAPAHHGTRAGVVGAGGEGLLAAKTAEQSAQVGGAEANVGVGIEKLVGEDRQAEVLGHLGAGARMSCSRPRASADETAKG